MTQLQGGGGSAVEIVRDRVKVEVAARHDREGSSGSTTVTARSLSGVAWWHLDAPASFAATYNKGGGEVTRGDDRGLLKVRQKKWLTRWKARRLNETRAA